MALGEAQKPDQTDHEAAIVLVHSQRLPLPLKDAAVWYDRLFEAVPTSSGLSACSEALRERQKCDEDGREEIAHLIYGEVPLLALAHILDKCDEYAPHDRREGVFVDLGSGTGRVVVGASLLRPFADLRGIEILPALHSKAASVLRQLQAARPAPAAGAETCSSASETGTADSSSQSISAIRGDFCESDWSDADVVFVNSTCFTPKLMASLEDRAKLLRPATVVVTLTRELQSAEDFERVATGRRNMSWGPASYFIYRRR